MKVLPIERRSQNLERITSAGDRTGAFIISMHGLVCKWRSALSCLSNRANRDKQDMGMIDVGGRHLSGE
jgi:hypothetical protein